MESGYLKGQSDNLPIINHSMVLTFFCSNTNFVSAEMKNVKTLRSTRESYGDNAIGYVQVKREGDLCFVKAKVTPEHRVKTKAYNVCTVINEKEGSIVSCACEDCAASQGGCKHATAVVFWLHRRSEEPAKTSTECYWRRSRLSRVGTKKSFIKASELGSKCIPQIEIAGSILGKIIERGIMQKGTEEVQLFKYFRGVSPVETLQISTLMERFLKDNSKDAEEFLKFSKNLMTLEACTEAAKYTIKQADCALWHRLKYGRITASKIYNAAHCRTPDGSLVETILGAKILTTQPMRRGIQLEADVIKELESKLNFKIMKSGIYLSPALPVFGASPDGISAKYVIEVKCPSTLKSMDTYFCGSTPSPRYMAQIQMQMHFAKKDLGIFCVACPDFERTKLIKFCVVEYDEALVQEILGQALEFWCTAIFPKLVDCKNL